MCQGIIPMLTVFLMQEIIAMDSLPALQSGDTTARQPAKATTSWPSLRFNFTLKRSSLNIYGQSNISLVASPTLVNNGSRVVYDAFATFHDEAAMQSYILLDGITYTLTRVADAKSAVSPQIKCAGANFSDILPVSTIVTSINEATALSSRGNTTIQCSSANLFKVAISDFDFILCALGASGFSMHHNDMDIEVEYLEKYVNISSLLMKSEDIPECNGEAQAIEITSTGQSLLTGEPIAPVYSRMLTAELDFSIFHKSKCSCRSKQRPCVFMHGLGVAEEIAANEDTFPRYWAVSVCDRILAVSDTSSDFVVADTIVVTHSMGGLLLSGAIANGKCSLASNSTWISMAAPMSGSMGSDYDQASCAGESNVIVDILVKLHNECPVRPAVSSLAYEAGKFSSQKLKMTYEAAQEAYRTNVSAVMCSENYAGLISKYQVYFWILGHMIPHKSNENDGIVEFQSCAAGMPEGRFGNSYLDRFYVTRLNHYDMTFRSGDALFNKAKMPMRWFECLL
ncbi:unnamed protein product [Phytophthora fragariaefolia]|uniref:Unnamed protein product n=1 Tax=Phytophthora fragariaefolia TaxID=1490495 RepID=A0A9W6YNT8_9STRA|nr:unnamed protein product [Phytophthora fragariaefolia]